MLPKISLPGLVHGSNCPNLNRNLCALRLVIIYFHLTKLCSLGLNLDSQLTMEALVNNVVRSCSFQRLQLRSIRQCLTDEAASTLVHAFIISRVDYSNSVFFEASDLVHRIETSISAQFSC